VLLGDVMNTAARIVDCCRETGHDYLAAAAVIVRTDLPADLAVTAIGAVTLRGKAAPLDLCAIVRSGSVPSSSDRL
jgi:class 3 adenylate cyclase